MQVAGLDADQLGDAHPRGIQHLDQRLVAKAARRRDVGLREQPVDLFEVEELRQRRPGPRRAQIVGGALVSLLLDRDEAIEAADARHRAGDRARRQPARHQAADERFEIAPLQRIDVDAALRPQTRRARRGRARSSRRVFGDTRRTSRR